MTRTARRTRSPSGRPPLGRDDAQAGTVTGPSHWRFLRWLGGFVLLFAAVLAGVLFIRHPRGKTPMDRAIYEVEDAMRRVGRPLSTGTTLTQLEGRLGSHSPEVKAYLRSLASGRYAPAPEPPPRSGRKALRRALAQGLGFGGGLRALWALPPRYERGVRAPRTRTLEVGAAPASAVSRRGGRMAAVKGTSSRLASLGPGLPIDCRDSIRLWAGQDRSARGALHGRAPIR